MHKGQKRYEAEPNLGKIARSLLRNFKNQEFANITQTAWRNELKIAVKVEISLTK